MQDPTELNSHLSTLKCPKCDGEGYLLMDNPLTDNPSWQCKVSALYISLSFYLTLISHYISLLPYSLSLFHLLFQCFTIYLFLSLSPSLSLSLSLCCSRSHCLGFPSHHLYASICSVSLYLSLSIYIYT